MRAVPRRQRARDAVQRILAATARLLDDAAFEALTTTALADGAGVKIATRHRCFPDKFPLVEALAIEQERDRAERLDPALQAFAGTVDWRGALRPLVEGALDLRLKTPDATGLHHGISPSA
jgi:AcrR family transcriptional regulator